MQIKKQKYYSKLLSHLFFLFDGASLLLTNITGERLLTDITGALLFTDITGPLELDDDGTTPYDGPLL